MEFVIPGPDSPEPRMREEGFGSSYYEINPIVFEAKVALENDPFVGAETYRYDPADWVVATWPVRLFWTIVGTSFRDDEKRPVRRMTVPGAIASDLVAEIKSWTAKTIREGSSTSWHPTFQRDLPIIEASFSYIKNEQAVGYCLVERFEDDKGVTYRVSVSDLITLERTSRWLDVAVTLDDREHARLILPVLRVVEVDLSGCDTRISQQSLHMWSRIRSFWRSMGIEEMSGATGRCLVVEDLREIGLEAVVLPQKEMPGYYRIVEVTRGDERVAYGMFAPVDPEMYGKYNRCFFVAASSSAFLALCGMFLPTE